MNSAALVATTHKRLERASDGTSTQVVTCIINKWRARISEMSLYNVRDPSGIGDWEICRKNAVATRTEIVSKSKRNIFKDHSPQILSRKAFFA